MTFVGASDVVRLAGLGRETVAKVVVVEQAKSA
jgi:hypothetical protein